MIRPFTCLCLVLAAGSGLFLYQTKHRAQMLDRDIAKTMKTTDMTRARAGLLRAEYQLLNDPGRLSELAGSLMPTLKNTEPRQFTTVAELNRRLPPIGLAPEPAPEPLPEPEALTAEAPAGAIQVTETPRPETPRPEALRAEAARTQALRAEAAAHNAVAPPSAGLVPAAAAATLVAAPLPRPPVAPPRPAAPIVTAQLKPAAPAAPAPRMFTPVASFTRAPEAPRPPAEAPAPAVASALGMARGMTAQPSFFASPPAPGTR